MKVMYDLTFSLPQLPQLQNGENKNTYPHRAVEELIYVKFLD